MVAFCSKHVILHIRTPWKAKLRTAAEMTSFTIKRHESEYAQLVISALPLIPDITLGKSFNFSLLQFPHLKMGKIMLPYHTDRL